MKNMEKTIKKLIDMAVDHYFDGLKPHVYAAAAAFAFTRASAAENSAASADAAAFVAALESASSINDLTHHLTKLAVSESNARRAMKTCQGTSDLQAEPIPEAQSTGFFFQKMVENKAEKSLVDEANKLYQSTFGSGESNNHRAALNAARANYASAYSSAHASYRYAIEMAARFSADETRRAVFATAVAKRLSAELNHQPIEPSFFMAIMCSITVSIVGWVLLVSGLMALSLGIAGLIYPGVSSVILNAGVGLASVTLTGAGATAVGSGVLACRFYTTRQWQRENDASLHAVEALAP